MIHRARPLLLSPAGDWKCLRAAIENGADAIYFGLEEFNARLRAHNFTLAELPEVMATVHARGVKGYVTMNTLIFPSELDRAARQIEACAAAGVDALIIQDIGLIRLCKALAPELPIHGSTQMTVTSVEGINLARALGAELVVLARETSLKELRKLRHDHPDCDLPLEMFIHGALCVAYSGQCLTSESLGGRSANRGECAQACRMPYDLIVDGQKTDLGDKKYLLSPQDLAGVEAVPELIDLGVACLKIEGRLKAPEYVANITQIYRRAIDEAWEKHTVQLSPEQRYRMEMAFSRGLYSGWFDGVNHQKLVHARFGKKRGVFVGTLKDIGPDFVELSAECPVTEGDGIVFDQGSDTENEQGGRIWKILFNGSNCRFFFERGKIDFRKLRRGDRVWKTNDPCLDRELRATFDSGKILHKLPVDMIMGGAVGKPLVILARIARPGKDILCEATSILPLEPARNQPLDEDKLRAQLGRLGDTAFELATVDTSKLEKNCILPVSEINRMRRVLAAELENKLRTHPGYRTDPAALNELRAGLFSGLTPRFPLPDQPRLSALCRSLEQAMSAGEFGIETVYLDYEDPRGYAATVQAWRQAFGCARQLLAATPRVIKQGERGLLKLIAGCGADGFLIRNYAAISFFTEERNAEHSETILVGDFSLNVSNEITADFFLRRGLDWLTVSYDLNAEQTLELLARTPPEFFEITLHQHMPMFHMEHCVFAAFLSKGTDHTNCGRPCERHSVRLRDRVGQEHPLKADVGCRNTLFNAAAQTGAEYFAEFFAAGMRRFRVEFVNENAQECHRTLKHYSSLLKGQIDGKELWKILRAVNQLGVTRGTLMHRSADKKPYFKMPLT